jgi:hypothetical protein
VRHAVAFAPPAQEDAPALLAIDDFHGTTDDAEHKIIDDSISPGQNALLPSRRCLT